jgi:hypothetical protein
MKVATYVLAATVVIKERGVSRGVVCVKKLGGQGARFGVHNRSLSSDSGPG